jgi:hypothetical protein
MHMHAGSTHGAIHGLDFHANDEPGHDHSADRDVSILVDTTLTGSRSLQVILVSMLLIIAVSGCQQRFRPHPPRAIKLRYRAHWRPLLRAPPVVTA